MRVAFASLSTSLLLLAASSWAAPVQPGPPPAADPRLAALPPVIGALENELLDDPEDTVLDVAYRHRLGFDRVARLNPEVNVWIPDPGTVIRLPTEHIVPDVPWRGLVINVPEMQLYDFTQKGSEPEIFAIAIGDSIDPSLHGSFKIGAKRENPAWHVPKAIQAERPDLPAVVPPGPDNPLGPFWMTIGSTSYGIHGSNNEWSIGREATHGCIRLYNDQVARLYARTKTGTPLQLLYQTIKLGRRDRSIYVEVHPDVYQHDPDRESNAFERLNQLGLLPFVDELAMRRAISEARGIPVQIGAIPEPTSEPGSSPAQQTPPLAGSAAAAQTQRAR